MYQGLVHAHSGLRWVVLLALIYAIYTSIKGKKDGSTFKSLKTVGTFTVASLHLQLILGLAMYFQSQWYQSFKEQGTELFSNATSRFYVLEHPILMILAVVFATIGNAKAKKAKTDKAAFQTRLVWFSITLALILIGIPWPFRFAVAGWY
ncbi:MAG TPA: cytochrome B [Bacteroidetes bacterium]|nr:cytochrome B [Bacteroidota bacterium]